MIAVLKRNIPFGICVFIALVYTLTTPLFKLGVPAELLTLTIYIPYVLCSLYAVYSTIKKFKENKRTFLKKHFDRILVVLFGIFCIILFIYRFVHHLNYMDGLHFAVRIIGAFGIYYAAIDCESINKHITKNLLTFSLVLNVVLIGDFLVHGSIRMTKILTNIIIVCCVVLLLNISAVKYHQEQNKFNWFYEICCILNFIITCLIIILSGSRLALAFGAVLIIYTLVNIFKNKKRFLIYLFAILFSALILVLLTMVNFGDSKRMVEKQIYTVFRVDFSETNPNDHELEDPVSNISKYSDLMRNDLIRLGIKEVKKNILFGTGNVNFEYVLNDETILQTPHNFLLESFICFGLFGTIMLALIAITIVLKYLLYKNIRIRAKSNFVLTLLILFGFSFLQPTLYNYMVLPVSLLTTASLYKE